MADSVLKVYCLLNFLCLVYSELAINTVNEDIFDTSTFVAWPNGVVPFYINQDHFDSEQAMTIMRSLSLFAFKSCLKFAPTMVPPTDDQHVLTFENPGGNRKCDLMRHGHPRAGPHRILLGYDCLKTPMLERVMMRALGFPFEHNRAVRDSYVSVQLENVDQSAVELFAKDYKLPIELRPLPYDIHSVTHFGDRDYSKNGHRTIIFKDRNAKQNRNGLSDMDLRKIEIVYGPECRKRDRQEKIELCHQYPASTVNRRKRGAEDTTKSLRVNPDITPPPEVAVAASQNISKEVSETLNSLGIALEVQAVVDQVYKLSAKALRKARVKFCNDTHEESESNLREGLRTKSSPDILGIIELVAAYAQSMVDNAIGNLTVFCEESKSIDKYRYGCWGSVGSLQCQSLYKSTKSGAMAHSTQLRPFIVQSTKHGGGADKPHREPMWRSRADINETIAFAHRQAVEVETVEPGRRKREAVSSEDEKGGIGLKDDLRMGTKRAPIERKVKYERARRHDSEDRSSSSGEARRARHRSDEDGDIVRPKPKRERELESSSKPSRKPKKNQKTLTATATVTLSKRNEEFYAQRRWPRGLVPYMIDKQSTKSKMYNIEDLRDKLDEVNKILMEKTCVRIQEIWERDVNKYEDYLVIDNSPDYVTGRVGGKQFFGSSELLKGGQHRQFTAMMVMAMLGFYFECSRHDRDKYIRVHLRHVRADKLHHFEKIRADATLSLPYDYKSATHPAWQFWRKVGKTDISTVATYKDQDPDGSVMRSLGQNEELLSEVDIIKINSVYGIQCMADPNDNDYDMKEEKEDITQEPIINIWPEKKIDKKKYKRKQKHSEESFSN